MPVSIGDIVRVSVEHSNGALTFAINDIVRIGKQPNGVLPHIAGETGFIDSFHEDGIHVGFTALRRDGSVGGCGTVPLECLVPNNEPHWVLAKQIYDETRAKNLSDAIARTERVRAGVELIAQEYKIPVEAVEDIHVRVHQLIRDEGAAV